MPRIRSIKPESCLSETLARLSERACLLFAYLPCFCDDEGRMRYSGALVKAQLFPLRDEIGAAECEEAVAELEAQGLVVTYEAGGKRYLAVTGFAEHQRPQKPKPSCCPPPPAPDSGTRTVAVPDAGGSGAGAVPDGDGTQAQPGETPDSGTGTVRVPDGYGTGMGSKGVKGRGKGKVKDTVGHGEAEACREVVAYLNLRSGKSFRPTSSQTRRLVGARLKEGFTVDDFRAVIDDRCTAWLPDAQRAVYLRPETLFGTKFEGYLQAALSAAPSGGGRYAQYR